MNTYAVIEAGGKQYQVAVGDVIDVERLEAAEGASVAFDRVLFCKSEKGLGVGEPLLAGVRVMGQVLSQLRGPKVIAYKYKRRKRSARRKVGHRQYYTRVKITEVADGT